MSAEPKRVESNVLGVRLSLQLLDPGLGLLEGSLGMMDQAQWRGERGTDGFGNIVDDHGGLRVPVVHGRKRAETLLPCGVPNLKLDHFVL